MERSAQSSTCARWRRSRELPRLAVARRVERPIAKRFPRFIEELKRLLKQSRRGCALRYAGLQDVETRAVPMDGRERSRSIGVGELELVAFDLVEHVPRVVRDLRVSLEELPRRVDDRALHVDAPVVLTRVALAALLLALLGSRGVQLF